MTMLIDPCFETYSPSEINRTMTIHDLLETLNDFNDDAKVVIRFDQGYTFGGITVDDIDEDIDPNTGEVFLMINVANSYYSMDEVEDTMTVAELADAISPRYPNDQIALQLKVVLVVWAFRSSRLFSSITDESINECD